MKANILILEKRISFMEYKNFHIIYELFLNINEKGLHIIYDRNQILWMVNTYSHTVKQMVYRHIAGLSYYTSNYNTYEFIFFIFIIGLLDK